MNIAKTNECIGILKQAHLILKPVDDEFIFKNLFGDNNEKVIKKLKETKTMLQLKLIPLICSEEFKNEFFCFVSDEGKIEENIDTGLDVYIKRFGEAWMRFGDSYNVSNITKYWIGSGIIKSKEDANEIDKLLNEIKELYNSSIGLIVSILYPEMKIAGEWRSKKEAYPKRDKIKSKDMPEGFEKHMNCGLEKKESISSKIALSKKDTVRECAIILGALHDANITNLSKRGRNKIIDSFNERYSLAFDYDRYNDYLTPFLSPESEPNSAQRIMDSEIKEIKNKLGI